VAAEVIAGQKSAFDARSIPAVVFSDPEIAVTGLSESAARAGGRSIRVGKFAFAANGRALGAAETDGFVKVILGEPDHELLGVGMVGAGVSDLVSELGLALEMGAVGEDLALTIHPHPTRSEVIVEAVRAALGEPLHALK
jgi:dihydrolipoamide dehydrogenase